MTGLLSIPRIYPLNRWAGWVAAALLVSVMAVPLAEAGQRKGKPEAKKQASSRSVDKTVRKRALVVARKGSGGRLQATLGTGNRPDRVKLVAVAHHPARHLRGKRAEVELDPPVPHLSFGALAGLHETPDALALKSSVALVVDQDTREVLLRKNDQAVLPIASLTKLMTGLIVSESKLPLSEPITIEEDDIDTEKHSRSRLRVGTTLSRGEMLHLALMSSENRAAHALGRTFPGGMSRFVSLMNARAMMLGMKDTRYVEPTGLSSANQSSASDLATLVAAAYQDDLLRQLSTSPGYEVEVGNRLIQFNNTNRLVRHPEWEIGLQKTGYISEAGQCLVMQAKIAGRKLIMVFLDSAGKLSRLGDAERVRRWLEASQPTFPAIRSGWRPPDNG